MQRVVDGGIHQFALLARGSAIAQLEDAKVKPAKREGVQVLLQAMKLRVLVALDRVGFMVEDRNRADGVFFVRYQDPEAEAPKKSGVAKLAFWRSDDPKNPDQFRIQVAAAPEASNGAQVRVLDRNGAPDGSDTAKRILALLVEQLK